jgi:hypothetical protein
MRFRDAEAEIQALTRKIAALQRQHVEDICASRWVESSAAYERQVGDLAHHFIVPQCASGSREAGILAYTELTRTRAPVTRSSVDALLARWASHRDVQLQTVQSGKNGPTSIAVGDRQGVGTGLCTATSILKSRPRKRQ